MVSYAESHDIDRCPCGRCWWARRERDEAKARAQAPPLAPPPERLPLRADGAATDVTGARIVEHLPSDRPAGAQQSYAPPPGYTLSSPAGPAPIPDEPDEGPDVGGFLRMLRNQP